MHLSKIGGVKLNKKKILILCIFVVGVVTVAIEGIIHCVNNRKGGNNALSVFEVNSSEITISNKEKEITLIGEDRSNLITKIKNIVNEGNDCYKAGKYDLTIDFKNGYKVYVSTENNILLFENERISIDNNDMNYIMQYLQD